MDITIDKEKIKNKARAALQSIGRGAVYGGVALAVGLGSVSMGYMYDSAHAGQNTQNMQALEKFDYYNDNANHSFVKAANSIDGGNGIPVKQHLVDFKRLNDAYMSDDRTNLTELERLIMERDNEGWYAAKYHTNENELMEDFRKGIEAENKINEIIGDSVLVMEVDGKLTRLPTMKDHMQNGIDLYSKLAEKSLNEVTPDSEASRLLQQEKHDNYLKFADNLTKKLNFLHANDKSPARAVLTAADGQLTSEQQKSLAYTKGSTVSLMLALNRLSQDISGKEKAHTQLKQRSNGQAAKIDNRQKSTGREI